MSQTNNGKNTCWERQDSLYKQIAEGMIDEDCHWFRKRNRDNSMEEEIPQIQIIIVFHNFDQRQKTTMTRDNNNLLSYCEQPSQESADTLAAAAASNST